MEIRALKQLDWKDIMVRILNSYNAISKSINPENLYKIELTSSQIKVLATFTERECYSMTELSQILSVTLPTMTAMIDRLILSGLVKRERDERDRRVVLVRLTGDGKKSDQQPHGNQETGRLRRCSERLSMKRLRFFWVPLRAWRSF